MDGERRPGAELPPSESWPQKSMLQRSGTWATLVMIAHPKCPCTRSSLDQLAEIVGRAPHTIKGYVLFTRPRELPSTWSHTSLWERASEIPGFTPIEDPDAAEAHLFGAGTSGHVLLYDADGQLRFSGGITSARGITGESAGKSSIQAYLATGKSPFVRTPVFGCSVDDSDGKR